MKIFKNLTIKIILKLYIRIEGKNINSIKYIYSKKIFKIHDQRHHFYLHPNSISNFTIKYLCIPMRRIIC